MPTDSNQNSDEATVAESEQVADEQLDGVVGGNGYPVPTGTNKWLPALGKPVG